MRHVLLEQRIMTAASIRKGILVALTVALLAALVLRPGARRAGSPMRVLTGPEHHERLDGTAGSQRPSSRVRRSEILDGRRRAQEPASAEVNGDRMPNLGSGFSSLDDEALEALF